MEFDTQDTLIQKCRSAIEETLDWGNSNDWSTRDFESLSEKILEKTHVQLSVITLKRMWGRIRYESKPTTTTLDALAQFIGYENWRTFKLHNLAPKETLEPSAASTRNPAASEKKRYTLVFSTAIILVSTGILLYFTAFKTAAPVVDPAGFIFSSKKIVDVGVPNTVVFDYDARAAENSDTIFIQQSWDKRLSRQVDRDQRQHTSIYYYPGFFQAKLRINDRVVQQHDLLIKSQGWLPLVDTEPVPVYFKTSDILQNGFMGLPLTAIMANNIHLQPKTPWTGYYNVGDFATIMSNDFIFETELKNEYGEGAAACRHTEVHLLFKGATFVLPLCIPGCVSEIDFADMSGKKLDLSRLGVDFSAWVRVRVEVRDSLARVFVNNKQAFNLTASMAPVAFTGMIFRFQGTGSVNYIKISKHNKEVIYEDDFEKAVQ